jgi:phospholipase D1/2
MEKRVIAVILILRFALFVDAMQSGVTFHEAQVALAKVYVGSDDVKGDTDEVVNIERPHDERTSVDQIGKKDTVKKAVKLPETVEDAQKMIEKFQNGAIKSDKRV